MDGIKKEKAYNIGKVYEYTYIYIYIYIQGRDQMQTLNIVQTPNYDLDRQKISTDHEIIATKNVNTMSTVDVVLKLY